MKKYIKYIILCPILLVVSTFIACAFLIRGDDQSLLMDVSNFNDGSAWTDARMNIDSWKGRRSWPVVMSQLQELLENRGSANIELNGLEIPSSNLASLQPDKFYYSQNLQNRTTPSNYYFSVYIKIEIIYFEFLLNSKNKTTRNEFNEIFCCSVDNLFNQSKISLISYFACLEHLIHVLETQVMSDEIFNNLLRSAKTASENICVMSRSLIIQYNLTKSLSIDYLKSIDASKLRTDITLKEIELLTKASLLEMNSKSVSTSLKCHLHIISFIRKLLYSEEPLNYTFFYTGVYSPKNTISNFQNRISVCASKVNRTEPTKAR